MEYALNHPRNDPLTWCHSCKRLALSHLFFTLSHPVLWNSLIWWLFWGGWSRELVLTAGTRDGQGLNPESYDLEPAVKMLHV